MKLFMSANSPYARKVRVLVTELDMKDRIEEISVNPRDEATGFWSKNPIAKIPALVIDNEGALGESDLISRYLLNLAGKSGTFDSDTMDRLSVLAIANGILDTGMVARVEKTRPGAPDTNAFVAKHLDAVTRGFDALETLPMRDTDTPDLADIAMVCAVDWIALRHPEVDVTQDRPALAARCAQLSSRPSFKSTLPG